MASTKRRPTQQRSRERVDAILRGTGEVIREHGVDALTPSSIAKACSIPPSAIYQYFDNADDVLRTFIDSEFERVAAAVAESVMALENISVRSMYGAVAQAHLDYFRSHPETVPLWIGGRLNPVVAETVSIHSGRLAKFLDATSRLAELIKPDTPQWAADVAIRTFDRTFEFIFSEQRTIDEQQAIVDEFVDMLATFSELRYATERGVSGVPVGEFMAAFSGERDIEPADFLGGKKQSVRKP